MLVCVGGVCAWCIYDNRMIHNLFSVCVIPGCTLLLVHVSSRNVCV